MNATDIAVRMTALTASLIAAAAAATPTAAASPLPGPPGPNDCDGVWGLRVQGAPAFFDAGDRSGDYLWHDGTGFHLRVTHRGDGVDVYTGVITSPTPLHLNPVRLEGHDRADLSPDARELSFVFPDHGHIDGIDFTTDCADSLTIGPLTIGDQPLPADRMYLGVSRINPDQIPFTIHRHED